MKSKHTPTPWQVWTEDKGRRDDVYIAGNPTGEMGGMRKLAYMIDTWDAKATYANAEFISVACNVHETLVQALEAVRNADKEKQKRLELCLPVEIRAKVDSALAKVKKV